MGSKESCTIEQLEAPLRLLTCDELGQIKALEVAGGVSSNKPLGEVKQVSCWGEPIRSTGVQCSTVSSKDGIDDADTALLAVARVGGDIEVRRAVSGEEVGRIASTSGREDTDASVRGLHFLWKAAGPVSDRLPAMLSVTSGGNVRIHKPSADKDTGATAWEQVAAWTCPGKVCTTAVDELEQMVAIGCEGTEVGVWDLAMTERVFLAKGSKPGRIALMERPWITAVAFVPGSKGTQVLAGTGYHKLRLYDTKQRRPIMSVDFGEGRITALAPQPDGTKCWVADSTGLVGCLDLSLRKMQQVLKGSGGSVRCLSVHPHLPLVASVGLDRFLRVHNTQTRQLGCRVFLKQHLSFVGFCPAPIPPLPSTAEQQQEEIAVDKKPSRKRVKNERQGRSKKSKA